MDSGGRPAAPPLVPPFVLFFYNTVSTRQGSEPPRTEEVSHLTLETKVHLALISNAHQKPGERKMKTREEGLEESNC